MRIPSKFKSIRTKMFITVSIVLLIIILLLILVNNIVLETFYVYKKTEIIKDVYSKVNKYYNSSENIDLEVELNKIATTNNFDIIIKTDENTMIFSTNSNTYGAFEEMAAMARKTAVSGKSKALYQNDKVLINKVKDNKSGLTYILLSGELDNEYKLYIRIPLASIEQSVSISNSVLILIGMLSVVLAGMSASFISRRFSSPIVELNNIAKKMSNLDFSQKYIVKDTEDEINELGQNINTMSNKLETTIRQLKTNNTELEKDIEKKSKIDEMRKQFISDVSHELKTPIALIQGYAEGLIENVNEDEESRKYYAEVILDESNKMDIMVKELLELMRLEYGNSEVTCEEFDISELISEAIRKFERMIKENNIVLNNEISKNIIVKTDENKIDQVVTNYLTNAIKYSKGVNNKREIRIYSTQKDNKVRIHIYNSGDKIEEEDMERIWKRFYKIDESRNRDLGGSGIGLSIVKAIMVNLNNDYGVLNVDDGVEFYFDVDLK